MHHPYTQKKVPLLSNLCACLPCLLESASLRKERDWFSAVFQEPTQSRNSGNSCRTNGTGASQVVLPKNPPANAGDIRDVCSTSVSGRSPGGGNGNPLQYSYLENPMDRGAWKATVYGVAKSWSWLSDWTCTRNDTCYNSDETWKRPSERNKSQWAPHMVWFPLKETSGKGKPRDLK